MKQILAVVLMLALVACGQAPDGLARAMKACGTDYSPYVEVDEAGLYVDGWGEYSPGVDFLTTDCLLGQLDAPGSVYTRMDQTTSFHGVQTAEWGDYRASWTFHPDHGLDLFVERT